MRSFTFAVYFIMIFISDVRAETLDFWNRSLTSIPFHQISDEVTDLGLIRNKIAAVDTFLFYPYLENLMLGSNLLSIFPNLCASGSSIKQLGLKNNHISHIPPERLDCLRSLRTLGLAQNKLSSFPAVSGPGRTLKKLDIGNNYFEEFPDLTSISEHLHTVLAGDNKLHTVDLMSVKTPKVVSLKVVLSRNSNLTTVQNLGFWNVKHLHLKGIGLNCDWSIGWIKMVESAGLVVEIDNQPCVSPTSLIGRDWTGIQLKELVRPGRVP